MGGISVLVLLATMGFFALAFLVAAAMFIAAIIVTIIFCTAHTITASTRQKAWWSNCGPYCFVRPKSASDNPYNRISNYSYLPIKHDHQL